MQTYLGFSTYNRARKFKVTDFDLVKQDLFNHFHIRRGEKLMNPDFGTIIWDMLYEPYTEALRDMLSDDIKRIVGYDPRLEVINITITEFTNGIFIELDLRYLPTNQLSRMAMNFDRDVAALNNV